MRISNTMGNRYSGTMGKETVASSWKGIHYLREYTIPADPKTGPQLRHRALFARAVEAWHALDTRQKEVYDRAAVGMTGYNLFIRDYIEAGRNGREPEIAHAAVGAPRREDKVNDETAKDIREDATDCPDIPFSTFE